MNKGQQGLVICSQLAIGWSNEFVRCLKFCDRLSQSWSSWTTSRFPTKSGTFFCTRLQTRHLETPWCRNTGHRKCSLCLIAVPTTALLALFLIKTPVWELSNESLWMIVNSRQQILTSYEQCEHSEALAFSKQAIYSNSLSWIWAIMFLKRLSSYKVQLNFIPYLSCLPRCVFSVSVVNFFFLKNLA